MKLLSTTYMIDPRMPPETIDGVRMDAHKTHTLNQHAEVSLWMEVDVDNEGGRIYGEIMGPSPHEYGDTKSEMSAMIRRRKEGIAKKGSARILSDTGRY